MSRAIFSYLTNTNTPEELINAIRQEPLLIYETMGYDMGKSSTDPEVVCFETEMLIPIVDANDIEEARLKVAQSNESVKYFEFEGMTFPSIKKEKFLILTQDEQKAYVEQLLDTLQISNVKVKKMALWSLSTLTAVAIADYTDLVDPGQFIPNHFDGRISNNNDIESISFEGSEPEFETSFSLVLDNHQDTSIQEVPESLVFDVETDFSSNGHDTFNSDQIENAVINNEDEITFDWTEFDDNSFDINNDNDIFDNFDLI